MKKKLFLITLFFSFYSIFTANVSCETLAPGLDVLGCGYNVFGEYADQKSKKRYSLFIYKNYSPRPIGSSLYNVPENVILENISNHIVKTVKGESIRDYAKSLAAKAGLEADTMFFEGSIESSYKKNQTSGIRKYYFTYMDANTKWRISLDERRSDKLRDMLDPGFVKDLQTLPPKELFKTYGTHYIASAYLGGRADFTSVSEISRGTTAQEIDIAVKAKYKAISLETNVSNTWSETFTKSKTKTNLRVVGGNSEYANNIQSWRAYKLWADGIDSRPVLCDFDKNSLKPIWTFCKDPKRKAELISAFKKMCSKRPLPKAMANIISMKEKLYMVKNKAFGGYWDLPDYGVPVDFKNIYFSLSKMDRRTKEKEGSDRFIKIIPHELDKDYVYLQPQNDVLAAAFQKGSSKGSRLKLGFAHKTCEESVFKMEPVEGEKNMYFLKSKSTGLYIDADSNGKIYQNKFSKSASQKWYFEEISADYMQPPGQRDFYTVKCKSGGKYWDFSGSNLEAENKGGKLKLWSMDKDPDRYVKFKHVRDGWYLIRPQHCNFVFDIPKGTKKNSRVALWDENRSSAQLFRFEYAGEPQTWYIRVKCSNKVLDAKSSMVNSNGCPVYQWDFHGGDNQKWVIQKKPECDRDPHQLFKGKYYIKSSYSKKYWDIPGRETSETNKNGAKLCLWDLDRGSDRMVRFVPAGGSYWWIEFQNGGKRLDVKGKSKGNGVQLHLWTRHDGDSQKFRIISKSPGVFVFVNKHSGKAIDVKGGQNNTKKNGSQLHQWSRHDGFSQKWRIVHADGKNKGKAFTIY